MNGRHAGGMRRVHGFGVSCLIRGVSGTLADSSSEVSDGDVTLGWPWDAVDRVFEPYGVTLRRQRITHEKDTLHQCFGYDPQPGLEGFLRNFRLAVMPVGYEHYQLAASRQRAAASEGQLGRSSELCRGEGRSRHNLRERKECPVENLAVRLALAGRRDDSTDAQVGDQIPVMLVGVAVVVPHQP